MTSGEGASSQDSELIDSVHLLTCSEELHEAPSSASQKGSLALINMIEKVAQVTSEPSPNLNSDNSTTNFMAGNPSAAAAIKPEVAATSEHHQQQEESPNKKKFNSASGSISGRKRAMPVYTRQTSLKKFTLISNSQKENLNFTPTQPKEPKEQAQARLVQKSSKLLTPQLKKSNQQSRQPLKLHKLVQK